MPSELPPWLTEGPGFKSRQRFLRNLVCLFFLPIAILGLYGKVRQQLGHLPIDFRFQWMHRGFPVGAVLSGGYWFLDRRTFSSFPRSTKRLVCIVVVLFLASALIVILV